jgi:hypothetical protein
LERKEEQRLQQSADLATDYAARIAEAGTPEELRHVAGQLTAEVKARLTANDLERVRRLYGARLGKLKTEPVEASANGVR